MDDQIMTREYLGRHMRKRAYLKFIVRAGRDSHGMNPSAAADDFEAEYDRLEAEARSLPRVQHAPAAGRGVEVRQADGVAA